MKHTEHTAPQELAAAIIAGTLPASAAMGRTDAYDFLTTGANGAPLALLGSSAKIEAAGTRGVLSTVLYMQPARESGREACAGRSAGCTAVCLAEGTGRMSMSGSRKARRRRHAAFYANRSRFLADLAREIAKHERKARKLGKVAAVRLNGTTDLPWHRMKLATGKSLHETFPAVHFYEYTKMPFAVQAKGGLPANLSLTFSVSERPDADQRAIEYLRAGHGAAVVMAIPRHDVPSAFHLGDPFGTGETHGEQAFPVVDGDAHDARFLDPAGSIVALAAKGRAKHDTSGFVRTVPNK